MVTDDLIWLAPSVREFLITPLVFHEGNHVGATDLHPRIISHVTAGSDEMIRFEADVPVAMDLESDFLLVGCARGDLGSESLGRIVSFSVCCTLQTIVHSVMSNAKRTPKPTPTARFKLVPTSPTCLNPSTLPIFSVLWTQRRDHRDAS